jgi:TolB protein
LYIQGAQTGAEVFSADLSREPPVFYQLTETYGAALPAHWSPDSLQIAFLLHDPQTEMASFWLIDIADGGAQRAVTSGGILGVDDFSWSPDGRFLTYHAPQVDGAERDVYRVDVATGEITNLTVGSPVWDSDPAFSPDGDMIAFVSDRSDEEPKYIDNIWLMGVDGSSPRQLTRSDWEDVNPAWSPGGTEIAFYRWSFFGAGEGGPPGLWAVELSSGEERLVAQVDGLIASGLDTPKWSPDGQYIVFQSGIADATELLVAPASGGEPMVISGLPGQNFGASWSADSQWLVFCNWSGGQARLYITSPEGGDPRPLFEDGGRCFAEWAPLVPVAAGVED